MGLDTLTRRLFEEKAILKQAANLVSLSRPLIGIYAVSHWIDDPVKLSAAVGVAFATDGLDGYLARKFGKTELGPTIDIVADRALEFIVSFAYAENDTIPFFVPYFFLFKSFDVDTNRALLAFCDDENLKSPLKAEKNDNQTERFAYGALKAGYFIGVPLEHGILVSILGGGTIAIGLKRWISGFYESSVQLKTKLLLKTLSFFGYKPSQECLELVASIKLEPPQQELPASATMTDKIGTAVYSTYYHLFPRFALAGYQEMIIFLDFLNQKFERESAKRI